MFTPSDLERMPIPIEQRMNELEMRIMEDIIRRIHINDEITRSADWQIYRLIQMGQSTEYIQQQIQQSLKLTDEEITKLYEGAIQSGYTKDKKLYEAIGKDFIPFRENAELQQLIQAVVSQTKSEMENITRTLGFAIDVNGKSVFTPMGEYLQRTLDTAVLEVTSGTFDYNSTLKKVVSEMTKSGVRSIDYETGWSNRIEVATRRALMTGVTQVTNHINDRNADELGTDKFEVSWHSTARPSHAEWQGRVYTKKQLVEICGLGTVTGLMGANCYHSYYPFIEGVSERQYTDKQLDQMMAEENKPRVYNGKEYTAYEATQHQRYLETLMRAQRRKIALLKKGGAEGKIVEDTMINYQDTMRKYKLFSKEMKLPQQMERVYMDGIGRVGGNNLKSVPDKQKLVNTNIIRKPINRDGKEIIYDGIINNEQFDKGREIITNLSNEYNTRLQTVKIGAYKGAGDVDISSSTMRLNNSQISTVIHEFAHTLSTSDGTKYGIFSDSDVMFWKEIRKLRSEYMKAVENNSARWISTYEHSHKLPDEFMAEAFAQAKILELGYELPPKYNLDLTYSSKVLEIINKYYKK